MSETLYNRTRRDGSGYTIRRENDGRVIGTLFDPAHRNYQQTKTTHTGIAVLHSAVTVDLTHVPRDQVLTVFLERIKTIRTGG